MMIGSEEWIDATAIFFRSERICFDILLEMRLSFVLFSKSEADDGRMRTTLPLGCTRMVGTTIARFGSHPASPCSTQLPSSPLQ
jgi:hypothetical protein